MVESGGGAGRPSRLGARPGPCRPDPPEAATKMPSRDDSSACVAVADLLKLSAASRRVMGLLDASALAGKAARELGGLVGTDVTALGVRESQNLVVSPGG